MPQDVVDSTSIQKKYFDFASSRLLQGALIVLLVFLAYFPATHGGFVWDDAQYVTGNTTLHSVNGLWQIWFKPGATVQYYPLTFTGFWLEYHLWGLNPLGYHVVNVFLHALNGLLLWLILKRLGVRGAWLGAAIFALHPVQVESVAWIAELKNTLSGVFFLGSIWAGLKFWLPEQMRPGSNITPNQVSNIHRGPWGFYVAGLVLYLFALWSKTAAVALPAVIFLLLWWKHGKVAWRNICLLLPFLAVGLVMGLITISVEKNPVGAAGSEWNDSWVERCLIASRILWFYLGKLLWPHPLMLIYPRWIIQTSQLVAYFPGLAAGIGLFILWCNRNGWGRPVLCATGYFIVMLFPVIGFFNVAFFHFSFVCDHFQYLASMAPLALAAAGITMALDLLPNRDFFLKAGFCGMLLLLLGTLTWRQTRLYGDDLTLWCDALSKNENAWNAHIVLGKHLYDAGQWEEAMVHYRRAIQINPNEAMAHNNYATTLWMSGRFDEAETEFQEAIRIAPDYDLAHADYCDLLLKRGKLDDAEREVRRMMRIAPDDPVSLYHYGYWLMLSGNLDNAETQLARAIQADPDYSPPRVARARLFRQRGRLNEAVQEYQSLLQRMPASERGRIGLAETFRLLGRPNEAIPCYRDVLRADPDNPDVRVGLGMALIEQGEFGAAEPEFSSVLQSDPKNAKAIDGLGCVLAMQGRADEAKARFLESMRLDPKYAQVHLHYAMCLCAHRQAPEAMMEYRKAMALDDQLAMACNNLAWMLAAYPDPQIRNGQEAVESGKRACRLTNNEQPFYLETLSAAYAEAGRFNDAIATAEKARDLARKAGLEKVVDRNEQLLELYRAGRPYHEPAEVN